MPGQHLLAGRVVSHGLPGVAGREAFDRPENEKKGVITVEGKMVERLHMVMAQRTVAIAEAIADMEKA